MRRIELSLAGIQVKFVDREAALRRIEDWAMNGTYPVQVVYGPEGCGKTAWLKQATELLRDLGFDVIYMNPIEREFTVEVGIEDIKKKLLKILHEATNESWIRATWAVIDLAKEVIKAKRGRLAVLVDDAFQAIGIDKAAIYVKGLLGLIEYPPGDYEVVITIAATSEGISLREIGRHRWAYLKPMWNMVRDGFKQLYDQIPGEKPAFNEAWRLTGGNPALLAELFRNGWDVGRVIEELKTRKDLTPDFLRKWRDWLRKAVEDPDNLWTEDAPSELINELITRNLIIYNLYSRDPWFWVDEPPLERDLELGIGSRVAWQTPLHREAVRKVLDGFK